MPSVKLPDGRIIKNVPEGTTKDQLTQKLIDNGVLTGNEDFIMKPTSAENAQVKTQEPIIAEKTQIQQPNTQTVEDSSVVQEEDQESGIGRKIGLGARNVLEGIASVPTFIPDLATLGINKAFGTDIQPVSSIVSEGLTELGFPEAKTSGERIAGTIIQSATGAGALTKGAKYGASKIAKAIAGQGTKKQAIAGAGAGAGVGLASEVTDNPLVQLGAGLVGGFAGSKIPMSKPKTPTNQTLLSDIEKRGFDGLEALFSVRKTISDEAIKQNKKINNLFEKAKTTGKEAFIKQEDLTKLSSDLAGEIDDVIDIDGKNFLKSTSDTIANTAKSDDISNTINKLQSFRRQASKVVRKDLSGSEGAKKVLEKIDKFLDTVDIQGNKKATQYWKKAIKERRDYGSKFENPAKIAYAVDESKTVEDVGKQFLGTGSVSTQKDLAKTYEATLRAVPLNKKKDTGFALRQSIVNQIIVKASTKSESADGLSASFLSNSIRNIRRENRSIWDKFPKEEKIILSNLERDLRKVSKGGVLNRVYTAMERLLSRGLRANIELPRTLKAKTIVTVDDLLELSKIRPKGISVAPAIATQQTIKEE